MPFLITPEAYYDEIARSRRRDRRVLRRPAAAPDPRRPRRRRLPAADLHEDRAGPADALLRGDRAPRRARLRRGQLQGAVRGDRARAGPARQPLARVIPGVTRPRCSAVRQREALRETGHRPWALPRGRGSSRRPGRTRSSRTGAPLRTPCRRSCPRAPGRRATTAAAWLGVHAFRVECLRLHGTLPVPWVSRFPPAQRPHVCDGRAAAGALVLQPRHAEHARRRDGQARLPAALAARAGSSSSERSGRLEVLGRAQPTAGRSRRGRPRAAPRTRRSRTRSSTSSSSATASTRGTAGGCSAPSCTIGRGCSSRRSARRPEHDGDRSGSSSAQEPPAAARRAAAGRPRLGAGGRRMSPQRRTALVLRGRGGGPDRDQARRRPARAARSASSRRRCTPAQTSSPRC